MKVYAYGEDAVTLWAIKSKLGEILSLLNDDSIEEKCEVFYRPSFGRSGGPKSSQFGEFDFIILSENILYLGESKWDGSSELQKGILELRDEQKLRHRLFTFYVEEWFKCDGDWPSFIHNANPQDKGIDKPIVPENSLLARNLKTVLQIISNHFSTKPEFENLILYLYNRTLSEQVPQQVSKEFKLASIDYSEATLTNMSEKYILMDI